MITQKTSNIQHELTLHQGQEIIHSFDCLTGPSKGNVLTTKINPLQSNIERDVRQMRRTLKRIQKESLKTREKTTNKSLNLFKRDAHVHVTNKKMCGSNRFSKLSLSSRTLCRHVSTQLPCTLLVPVNQ